MRNRHHRWQQRKCWGIADHSSRTPPYQIGSESPRCSRCCTSARSRWRGHRKRWGSFAPCRSWTSKQWAWSHTWWWRTQQQHSRWRTRGWQGGSQGRRRWWTSRDRSLQCLVRSGLTRAAGRARSAGRPSRSRTGKWASGTGSPGRCSRRSCRWMPPGRTGCESCRLWPAVLSRGAPWWADTHCNVCVSRCRSKVISVKTWTCTFVWIFD